MPLLLKDASAEVHPFCIQMLYLTTMNIPADRPVYESEIAT